MAAADPIQVREYNPPMIGAANQSARAFYAALGYREEDVRLTKNIRKVTG